MLPWDAIRAVYRGRQLVVAGDQKQLTPSTFFDRMVNNNDDLHPKSAAHELGFQRTGNRITEGIQAVIQILVQKRLLRDAGDDRLGKTDWLNANHTQYRYRCGPATSVPE